MSNETTSEDYTLSRAHGTVMVFSWMIFASTGILFARYGRSVQFKKRKQILGEDTWFQVHRFSLTIAVVGTLLGFFLILGQAGGRWVDLAEDGGRIFAHSILGGIIVGCALIQAWMALFRCHPESPFRFIFNWIHRSTGMLAFILSVPTIFIIVYIMPNYNAGFVTIMSLWTAWIVIIFVVFEIIEYFIRSKTSPRTEHELNNEHAQPKQHETEASTDGHRRFNRIKQILYFLNLVFSIGLVIPLVILLWMQG